MREPEQHINIHATPETMGGVYANFANVSHSDYEFSITFVRLDHESAQGEELEGVVVTRVNMSPKFMKELIDAMADNYSKYTAAESIKNLPETSERRPIAPGGARDRQVVPGGAANEINVGQISNAVHQLLFHSAETIDQNQADIAVEVQVLHLGFEMIREIGKCPIDGAARVGFEILQDFDPGVLNHAGVQGHPDQTLAGDFA